jgi:DNA-binding transcriptional LysR family regulator
MALSLESLAVLDAIDRRGSFAAAAIELDRVPSAITYTVRRLEDEFDVLLFDRRGHRARFTPAGRALLAEGRALLASVADMEQRVRRVATGWESELRIAVDALVPLASVFPRVAAFYADCARQGVGHTRIALTREVLGGSWDALAENRADLVLGATGDPPPGGGYRARVLAEMSVVFAVAPGHPLAGASEPLAEAEIARHRGVVAADTSRRLPPRSVGTLSGQETLTVPDLDAKLAAQVAGLGCGFLPFALAADAIADGRLVVRAVEMPRPSLRLQVAWRAARPGRALAWWIDAAMHADWRALALTPNKARTTTARRARR